MASLPLPLGTWTDFFAVAATASGAAREGHQDRFGDGGGAAVVVDRAILERERERESWMNIL